MGYAECDVYCDTLEGPPYCCPFGASCAGGECVCSWRYGGPGPCEATVKVWLLLGMVAVTMVSVVAVVAAWHVRCRRREVAVTAAWHVRRREAAAPAVAAGRPPPYAIDGGPPPYAEVFPSV